MLALAQTSDGDPYTRAANDDDIFGGPRTRTKFTYDPLGNITNKTLGSRVVDTAYDSLNHVSQVRDTAVSSAWRTYSYDTRGNVTADGIHSFTNDDANQPTSISGSGAGTYTYDGNLRRVKTVSGGATTYTFYDRAGNLLGRNNRTTSKKTDYLSVGGQTFVRVTNGVASYPINDHLGTALWVAAQSGAIQASQTYNYNPSGEAITGSGAGHLDEQGFTGHVEDASNLTYMQARYYDPVIGRFLEADPIGYEGGPNLYAYIGNDPLNKVDPTGTQEIVLGGQWFEWMIRPSEATRPIGEMVKPAERVGPAPTPVGDGVQELPGGQRIAVPKPGESAADFLKRSQEFNRQQLKNYKNEVRQPEKQGKVAKDPLGGTVFAY